MAPTLTEQGTGRLASIIIILSLCLFAVQVHLTWSFTVDDSFILFRYSHNLALGHGPTWNPGDGHTEGYTSFLWMILIAVPHVLGIDAVLFAKVIGVIATLGTMLICFVLANAIARAENDPNHRLWAAWAVLFLSSCPMPAIHAVSGMETALFTFLLTTFTCFLTMMHRNFTKSIAVATVGVGLLVALTRPEGNLPVALGLALAAVKAARPNRAFLVRSILLVYVLPGALYFLWRYNYYGLLFPLPFYAKVSGPSTLAGLSEFVALLSFLATSFGPFIVLGSVKRGSVLLLAGVATCSLIVFSTIPDQIMGYQFRYFYPAIPFLLVVAALGVGRLHAWLAEMHTLPLVQRGSLHITVLVALIPPLLLIGQAYSAIDTARIDANALSQAHIQLGKRLNAYSADGSQRVALVDAGAIPYYSRWRAIDTWGLNDPKIGLSRKVDPAYVLSQDPDLVIVLSRNQLQFVPFFPFEVDLFHKCLEKGMVPLKAIRTPYYYLWLMAYPDRPLASFLLQEDQ